MDIESYNGVIDMSTYTAEMEEWCQKLENYHLPRWNELPDIELYMDQVVTLIEKHVRFLSLHEDKLLTSAMINNYVKLGLMPKPEKKRYERTHLAYLIVITLLKQVLTITEVKDGILLQSRINGTHGAYDLFCQELEHALKRIASTAQLVQDPAILVDGDLTKENLAVKMVSNAYAYKLLTEKILSIRQQDLPEPAESKEKSKKGD